MSWPPRQIFNFVFKNIWNEPNTSMCVVWPITTTMATPTIKKFHPKNENNKREIHQKKKCYRIWAVTTTELALYYRQLNNKKKKKKKQKRNKQEFVSFKSDTPQRKEEKGHRHTNQFEVNILMHLERTILMCDRVVKVFFFYVEYRQTGNEFRFILKPFL